MRARLHLRIYRVLQVVSGGEWESRTPKPVTASRFERGGLANAQTRQWYPREELHLDFHFRRVTCVCYTTGALMFGGECAS